MLVIAVSRSPETRPARRGNAGAPGWPNESTAVLIRDAVALKRVRGRAQRNAIEIEAAAGPDDGRPVARRPGHADPRRDIVGVERNRIGQTLQVVAEPAGHGEAGAGPPFVLHEQDRGSDSTAHRGVAERLLKLLVDAALQVRQRRERVDALQRARKEDRRAVVEKSPPALIRWIAVLKRQRVRHLHDVEVAARSARTWTCRTTPRPRR